MSMEDIGREDWDLLMRMEQGEDISSRTKERLFDKLGLGVEGKRGYGSARVLSDEEIDLALREYIKQFRY